MKTMILIFAFVLSAPAFATPETAVSDVVTKLIAAVSSGNEQRKMAGLCSLAKSKLDTNTISAQLLGSFFSKLSRDSAGIAKFKKLVPSIVVDQFYDLLKDKGGASFTIKGRTPKGSGRTGVLVDIDGKRFTITVNSSEKVVDVEYRSFSAVKNKANDFQNDLQADYARNRDSSLPVTDLVNSLVKKGVTKCGAP